MIVELHIERLIEAEVGLHLLIFLLRVFHVEHQQHRITGDDVRYAEDQKKHAEEHRHHLDYSTENIPGHFP